MRTLGFQEAADIVKSSLDIVEVVSRHVALKKTGRNYSGLCPFHREKSPSFNVNREKNLFKCFGCGEAGDALAFLMKRENKTYGEIIHDLAAEQGLEIIREGKSAEEVVQQRDATQKILELNQMSLAWFQNHLNSSDAAPVRAYLENRQIPQPLVEGFMLGFAPPGWENLTRYLTHQVSFIQSNPDLLVMAGLANNRMEGQGYYDRFRNRLIIPIHDEQGRVVGFGGRALADDDKPKYLNSPETPLYVKNRILYGLHQAKESIRQTRTAVVMEGYFDVISAHMGGVTQAVGSCGTALTENHLKLLTRFGAETVYLSFDSDEAGLKAAMSAIEMIETFPAAANLSLKVVIVPSGKDPDEFIRQTGGEAFQTLMAEAPSFLDFKFENALRGVDVHTPEGRVMGANKLTPMLAAVRHPVLRAECVRKCAERLGISPETLTLEIKRYEGIRSPKPAGFFPDFKKNVKKGAISKYPSTSYKSNPVRIPENVSELRKPLASRSISAERALLRLLFINDESYALMLPTLNNLTFAHPAHQSLLEAIRRVSETRESLNGLIQTLNAELAQREDVRRTLVDIAFSAESWANTLGLSELPPAALRENVGREARKYQAIIEDCQRNNHLRQLAQQAEEIERSQWIQSRNSEEQSELSLLELQYQLRERLAQPEKKLL